MDRDGQVGGATVFELYSATEAREGRGRQWCAALAVVGLCIAQLLAAAVLFWGLGTGRDELDAEPDHPGREAVVYVYALLSWTAQTVLAASVPLVPPPQGSLDDPFVRPRRRVGGESLSALMLLPAEGFDAATAATLWFLLTSRGHSVTVATVGGERPVPDPASVQGYGPGLWGAGALAAAMYERMVASGVLRRPLNVATAVADAFDALVLPGGSVAGSARWAADPTVQRVAAACWVRGVPAAACGTGSMALAWAAQHADRQRLSIEAAPPLFAGGAAAGLGGYPAASGAAGGSGAALGAATARAAAERLRQRSLLHDCSVTGLPWQLEAGGALLACLACAPDPNAAVLAATSSRGRGAGAAGRLRCGCSCCGRTLSFGRCCCFRRADCVAGSLRAVMGRAKHPAGGSLGCCRVAGGWLRKWAFGCDCCRGSAADCGPCEALGGLRLALRSFCALCCSCFFCCGAASQRSRSSGSSPRRGSRRRESESVARESAWRDGAPSASGALASARMARDEACIDCVRCVACGWRPAQAEVAAAVGARGRFLPGPGVGLLGERGTPWDDSAAFVVEDGLLLSGRWGGDAFLLGRRLLVLMEMPQEEQRSWR